MKHLIIIIILTILPGIFSGCNQDFEEMNTDPFQLTEIDDEYLITTSIRSTMRDLISTHHYRFSAQYAHFFVGISIDKIPDEYKVVINQSPYDEIFRGVYGGGIRYANEVIRLTSEGKGKNETRNAIAHIMAVINYAKLTDTFGDIPYLEGGWGQEGFLLPTYDTQEFIYKDMLDRLEKSVDILRNSDPRNAYPGADPLFDNDLDKWIRLANSLRFRLAMRIRHVDPQTANPVISDCVKADLLDQNDQNATLECFDKDDGSLYNPWSQTFQFFRFKISEKIVEWLKSTLDPRLYVYANANPNGEYRGMPNGLGDQSFSDWDKVNTSSPGQIFTKRDADLFLMVAAETWFLKAEAALFGLGLTPGDANLYYRNGIRASMEQWSVPEDSITQFLAQSPQSNLTGTNEEKFEQISMQMWVALAPNFIEAYAHMRRTGYPKITKRQAPGYSLGDTDGVLPARLRYPIEEELNNPDNYGQAVANQGPDLITTRLWWDVRR